MAETFQTEISRIYTDGLIKDKNYHQQSQTFTVEQLLIEILIFFFICGLISGPL
jgi:hypothetical protein